MRDLVREGMAQAGAPRRRMTSSPLHVTRLGRTYLRDKRVAARLAWSLVRSRFAPPASGQHLIGTHHKVMTVYMKSVFQPFAIATGRSYCHGSGQDLDYSADILSAWDSAFRPDVEAAGIHIRRDPRDLLVSATHYHIHARELWLHVPRPGLGGKTYQEHLKSLPTFEAAMLFEMQRSTRRIIKEMASWPGHGCSELRYEDLITPEGADHFDAALEPWGLDAAERRLLVSLFRHHSIHGPAAVKRKHIRNPEAGQWREHFTPAVERRFMALFADDMVKLGYA